MTSHAGTKKLLLEAAVIVASILLAFALDASWDAAAARAEARSLLSGLQEEFAASQSAVEGIIQITEHEASVASSLAQRLRGATQVEVSDSILVLVLNDITFNPGAGAFESLVGSGRLAVLEAQELQNALAAWPSLLEDGVEEQRRLQRLGDEQLKPLLESLVSDLGGVYEMLARWEVTLGSASMSEGRPLLRSSPTLVNLLERRAYLLRITAVELQRVLEHLALLQALIGEELS